MKKENKLKIISIVEGIIIIVLVVLLITSNTGKEKNSNTETKVNNTKANEYVGIYHTTNYNKNLDEVNITLNKDFTCSFSAYNSRPYKCNYEELEEDKIKIVFKGFSFEERLAGFFNRMGATKEECENRLKELQETQPGQGYDVYKNCKEYTEEHEATITTDGLLYENKLYYKIK